MILIFVLAGCAPSGWCAFKIGLNEGRSPITAVGVASINRQGIVFSPAPGQAGFIRYKWTEFSAGGLIELQQILPRERAFQQKSGIDKVEYLQLISDELRKIAPQKPAVPIPIPVQPKPPPVKIVQAAPAIAAPVAPASEPKNPAAAAPPVLPNKKPKPKPETEVETAPAFHLIQPAGTSPGADHRPPESGWSFAAIFSPAGVFLVLVIMGFSVYAGNEIARFRNRPKSLVCAVSAIFPIIGPAIFLLLPDPAAKYAGAMSEANDPFLINPPGNPSTVETVAPTQAPGVKYEDDQDSPYHDLIQDGDETQMEAELVAGTAPKPMVMELYLTPEYQFDFKFFNQYFQRFINSQPSDGQALILRTRDLEYPVHYITELSPDALNIIYPSGDEWHEDNIAYESLEEVEVTGFTSQ